MDADQGRERARLSGVNDEQRLIVQVIGLKMESLGWRLRRQPGLPPCYARDTRVTPFLSYVNLPRRESGNYLIEGVVGVIHQAFEELWMQNPNREPKEPGFGCSLYTANLREVQEKRYIPCDAPLEGPVSALCSALSAILERMPADEHQLIEAFERNDLLGFEVRAFSGYSHRPKFRAFEEFVRHLPRL